MIDMRALIQIANGAVFSARQQGGRLMERLVATEYENILTESARSDFLLKTYGEKLSAKYEDSLDTEPRNVVEAVSKEPGEGDAQKLLSYLASFDPTPNHLYTQWLCVRYLKDALRLEDGERAHEYLSVFEQSKRRIANKDINAYPTMEALHAAIEPFMTDATAMMDLGAGDARLARRMGQEDQITVCYDKPDMSVIIPLTQQAATYWGRNTDWCTAWGGPMSRWPDRTNQFAHYNAQGPLYIVTIKFSGEQYQLCFGAKMFCDRHDHKISLVALAQENPNLIKACDESNFLPYVKDIGVELFSPGVQKRLFAASEGRRVTENESEMEEELASLAPEIRNSVDFQHAFLEDGSGNLRLLDPASYVRNLPALLRKRWAIWNYVPDDLRTPELAEIAARGMTNKGSTFLTKMIPEQFWTPAIHQFYYQRLNEEEAFHVRLATVPEAYRTPQAVALLLSVHPEDIFENLDAMTPEIAKDMMYRNATVGSYLPAKMFDDDMIAYIHQLVLSTGEHTALLRCIPKNMLTRDDVKSLLTSKIVDFNEIPEQFVCRDFILLFLNRMPGKVEQVPKELVTPEMTGFLYPRTFSAFVASHPDMVGDADVRKHIARARDEDALKVYESLPRRFKTEALQDDMATRGLLSIKDIPNLNDAKILARLQVRWEPEHVAHDISEIPSKMLTPDLVFKIIDLRWSNVAALPRSSLTPTLLARLLSAAEDHFSKYHERFSKTGATNAYARSTLSTQSLQRVLEKFPSSAWTEELQAKAEAIGLKHG